MRSRPRVLGKLSCGIPHSSQGPTRSLCSFSARTRHRPRLLGTWQFQPRMRIRGIRLKQSVLHSHGAMPKARFALRMTWACLKIGEPPKLVASFGFPLRAIPKQSFPLARDLRRCGGRLRDSLGPLFGAGACTARSGSPDARQMQSPAFRGFVCLRTTAPPHWEKYNIYIYIYVYIYIYLYICIYIHIYQRHVCILRFYRVIVPHFHARWLKVPLRARTAHGSSALVAVAWLHMASFWGNLLAFVFFRGIDRHPSTRVMDGTGKQQLSGAVFHAGLASSLFGFWQPEPTKAPYLGW